MTPAGYLKRVDPPFTFLQTSLSNFFWGAEHILRRRLFDLLFGGAERRHRANLLTHLQKRGPGRRIDVDRVEGMDRRTFRRHFHKPGVPVIFAGAAKDWTCCKLWSPSFFAEKYGDELCSITDYGDDSMLPLREVVRLTAERKLRGSQFSRVVHNNKELSGHIDLDYLRSFCGPLSHKTTYQFFMGPPGMETKMHAGGTNNFHIQVHGEKTWWIVDIRFNPVIRPRVNQSPLLSTPFNPKKLDDAFPTDAYVDIYRAKLYPGDILFIPAFYWHHVSYDTESIATGFRWVAPRDVLRAWMMFAVMATATKPLFFEYYAKFMLGKLIPFYGSKREGQTVR